MSHHVWTLADRTAILDAGCVTARIDLAAPDRGIQGVQYDGRPLAELGVLGIIGIGPTSPFELGEAYVRGHDLVVEYAVEQPRLILRVYWSTQYPSTQSLSTEDTPTRPIPPPGETVALYLTASLLTEELDVELDVLCRSTILTSNLRRLVYTDDDRERANPTFEPIVLAANKDDVSVGDGRVCTVVDCGDGLLYAEVPHPLDVRESILRTDAHHESRALLEHRLFVGHLEKGVILRARVLGVFSPEGAGAARRVGECCRAFAAMEPPLDT